MICSRTVFNTANILYLLVDFTHSNWAMRSEVWRLVPKTYRISQEEQLVLISLSKNIQKSWIKTEWSVINGFKTKTTVNQRWHRWRGKTTKVGFFFSYIFSNTLLYTCKMHFNISSYGGLFWPHYSFSTNHTLEKHFNFKCIWMLKFFQEWSVDKMQLIPSLTLDSILLD